MRVCLALPLSTGGIGRHVRTLVDGLGERSHAVTVVAPAADDVAFGFSSAGARFVAAPVGAGSPTSVARFRAAIAVQSRDADVVHVHGVRAAASVFRGVSAPVVATWHNAPIGSASRRAAHALLERVAVRAATVTIGASEDLVDRARRAGARDARFVPVVAPLAPEGAPISPRSELPSSYFLVLARLAEQKRIDVVIRATAGWADDPGRPRIVVAGDGPLRAELEANARAARAPITFLGHADDSGSLLAGALALVLSSDWEARPLAIQEAMRVGVPVIATAVGGVPGLVGDAGLLVPPGEPSALRDAMESMTVDEALRTRLSQASLERARQLPTVTDMIDQLLDIYVAISG